VEESFAKEVPLELDVEDVCVRDDAEIGAKSKDLYLKGNPNPMHLYKMIWTL